MYADQAGAQLQFISHFSDKNQTTISYQTIHDESITVVWIVCIKALRMCIPSLDLAVLGFCRTDLLITD